MRWLAQAGIRDIVINLHHLGEAIAAALGDGAAFGVRITYSRETTLLETGGGIVKALPLLGDRAFRHPERRHLDRFSVRAAVAFARR